LGTLKKKTLLYWLVAYVSKVDNTNFESGDRYDVSHSVLETLLLTFSDSTVVFLRDYYEAFLKTDDALLVECLKNNINNEEISSSDIEFMISATRRPGILRTDIGKKLERILLACKPPVVQKVAACTAGVFEKARTLIFGKITTVVLSLLRVDAPGDGEMVENSTTDGDSVSVYYRLKEAATTPAAEEFDAFLKLNPQLDPEEAEAAYKAFSDETACASADCMERSKITTVYYDMDLESFIEEMQTGIIHLADVKSGITQRMVTCQGGTNRVYRQNVDNHMRVSLHKYFDEATGTHRKRIVDGNNSTVGLAQGILVDPGSFSATLAGHEGVRFTESMVGKFAVQKVNIQVTEMEGRSDLILRQVAGTKLATPQSMWCSQNQGPLLDILRESGLIDTAEHEFRHLFLWNTVTLLFNMQVSRAKSLAELHTHAKACFDQLELVVQCDKDAMTHEGAHSFHLAAMHLLRYFKELPQTDDNDIAQRLMSHMHGMLLTAITGCLTNFQVYSAEHTKMCIEKAVDQILPGIAEYETDGVTELSPEKRQELSKQALAVRVLDFCVYFELTYRQLSVKNGPVPQRFRYALLIAEILQCFAEYNKDRAEDAQLKIDAVLVERIRELMLKSKGRMPGIPDSLPHDVTEVKIKELHEGLASLRNVTTQVEKSTHKAHRTDEINKSIKAASRALFYILTHGDLERVWTEAIQAPKKPKHTHGRT